MKVKELSNLIKKFDPELELIFYTEDEGLLREDHSFTLFDFSSIELNDAERLRGDGVPSLKFGRSERSEKMVTVAITSIF